MTNGNLGITRSEEWFKQELRYHGAIVENSHMVEEDGTHIDGCINMDKIDGRTELIIQIGRAIAAGMFRHEAEIQESLSYQEKEMPIVVIGQGPLGKSIAESTAIAFGCENFAWCEIRRFFKKPKHSDAVWSDCNPQMPNIVRGARCYIVNGALTEESFIPEMARLIDEHKGIFAGVVVVAKSDSYSIDTSVRIPWFHSLITVGKISKWPMNVPCRQCSRVVKMKVTTERAHRWCDEHPDYPIDYN